MIIAVYPGTFDPLTRGHEDLVRRAATLFDKVVVGIAHSRNKKPFFSIDERVDIAREVLGHYPNVEVQSFGGLLKDFVRDQGGRVIVRGPVSYTHLDVYKRQLPRRCPAGLPVVHRVTPAIHIC